VSFYFSSLFLPATRAGIYYYDCKGYKGFGKGIDNKVDKNTENNKKIL
jgi:hypothetical protein